MQIQHALIDACETFNARLQKLHDTGSSRCIMRWTIISYCWLLQMSADHKLGFNTLSLRHNACWPVSHFDDAIVIEGVKLLFNFAILSENPSAGRLCMVLPHVGILADCLTLLLHAEGGQCTVVADVSWSNQTHIQTRHTSNCSSLTYLSTSDTLF